MSLLLQVLLGANVDVSGLSSHVDGRTSLDMCDNLPMSVGADEVVKERQIRNTCGDTSFIFRVKRMS